MKKYRSILAIILLCLLVIIVGTYAWLSWKSNEMGLKLTIGSIENVRLTISPYKIDSSIIPTLTYEGEKYSQIEIINNGIETKNLELYYEINNIDEEYTYEELSSNYACADPNNPETLITVGNPIFTYTGNWEVVDDGDGNWKVRLLTSGDFTSKSNMLIDAFLVGGGAVEALMAVA